MNKIVILIAICLATVGCTDVKCNLPDQQTITTSNKTVVSAARLTSFGDDKAIYIDQNNIATIISKSGDVISKTNLNTAKPIDRAASWKTSIPAHNNDTLYADAEYIDDVIYYNYYITKGKTYGMKPYLGFHIKLVDLPCQSGWVGDVDDKRFFSCSGKVNASLSIWKSVVNEPEALHTTVKTY